MGEPAAGHLSEPIANSKYVLLNGSNAMTGNLARTVGSFQAQLALASTGISANRVVTLDSNNGDRTVSLSGNLTVESASLINQDLTTDSATVQFARGGYGVAAHAVDILSITQADNTASAYGINLTHTGTGAGSAALNITKSGVVVGTSYGASITVSGGGTTNCALSLSATGATNNYGMIVANGNVGIGSTTPAYPLVISKGFTDPGVAKTGVSDGLTITATSGVDNQTHRGLHVTLSTSGTQNFTGYYEGAEIACYNYSSGVNSHMYGTIYVCGIHGTGNVSSAYVLEVETYGLGAGTFGNITGLNIANMALYNAPTGVITGVSIGVSATVTGTTKYGLYVGNQAGATTNYAIYTAGGETYHTTAVTTDLSKCLNVSHTGACAGGAGTGYALYASKTGISTLNVGGYFTASGGTANYALQLVAAATDYYIYINTGNFWDGYNQLAASLFTCVGGGSAIFRGRMADAGSSVSVKIACSSALTVGAKTVAGSDRYITGFYNDAVTTLQAFIASNGVYGQRDGATYFGLLSFASTTALGANHMLTVDLCNGDRTIAWNATGDFYINQTSTVASSAGLNILHSGLVAGGLSTVYGQRISVTGANAVNIGLDFSGGVTGATTNYCIYIGANDYWKSTGYFKTSVEILSSYLYASVLTVSNAVTAYSGNTAPALVSNMNNAASAYGAKIGCRAATFDAGTDRWLLGMYRDNVSSLLMARINTLGQYETLDTSAAFYVRTQFSSNPVLSANHCLTINLLNLDQTLGFGLNGSVVHPTLTPVGSGGGSTAGTLGEIAWDSSYVYVCNKSGGAGVATWLRGVLAAY